MLSEWDWRVSVARAAVCMGVTSECTALLGRRSVSEGFRTVASARALRQPTSCGSEYFYNQRPQVQNLIGTEHSLNRSERRVKREAS